LAAKSQRSGRLLVVIVARAAFTRRLIGAFRLRPPGLSTNLIGLAKSSGGIVGGRGASPSSDPISQSCVAEVGGRE